MRGVVLIGLAMMLALLITYAGLSPRQYTEPAGVPYEREHLLTIYHMEEILYVDMENFEISFESSPEVIKCLNRKDLYETVEVISAHLVLAELSNDDRLKSRESRREEMEILLDN